MDLEPIESVGDLHPGFQSMWGLPSGTVYCHETDVEDMHTKAKYLYLSLWEHGTGRELAKDHDIEGVDDKGGKLVFNGTREQECAWILDCWQHEDLRPFFDAVELLVKE